MLILFSGVQSDDKEICFKLWKRTEDEISYIEGQEGIVGGFEEHDQISVQITTMLRRENAKEWRADEAGCFRRHC